MSHNQNKYLKRSLSQELKLRKRIKPILFCEQKGRCAYCGKLISLDELTIDHIIPLSLGGDTELSNVVGCCLKCNRLKGNRNIWDCRDMVKSHSAIDKIIMHWHNYLVSKIYKRLKESYNEKSA